MLNEDDADGVAGAAEAPDVGDTKAARAKAESILARDRAAVDEIAWAWVTLLDLQAGNGMTLGETRYRKILFAKEEIEKLGLLKTDKDGFPIRKYNGVPVSGMNDRAESQGLVSVTSAREATLSAGGKWPSLDAVQDGASRVVNRTGEKRHYLAHVFERAIANIDGNTEVAAVWTELKEMALNGFEPLRVSDKNDEKGKGKLKYSDSNGDDSYYSYRALDKWLLRNTPKRDK